MTLVLEFLRKIAGKANRFSVSIPAEYLNTYLLEPGQYVNVSLLMDPNLRTRKFASQISKCGYQGRLIYIPKKFSLEYHLEKGKEVYVILEVL